MFKTLEEKHHLDLQQQNRLHKEALFNLQQSMEDELLDQQKSFRQKLTVHKEALSQSLNRSLSPINSVYDLRQFSPLTSLVKLSNLCLMISSQLIPLENVPHH
jgi:hypothetical protein